MKKLLLAVMLLSSTATIAQSTWAVDAVHSKVTFNVSHMMISDVDGYFKIFDGQLTASKEDLTDAVISFTVDAGSINTDNEKRDGHLKSDDFFAAEKYPKITFKSTSFKKVSGNKYLLTGNLTIRDVTKPVTFDVTYNGTVTNPYKMTVAGFKATGSINRFDYNLKFDAKMDNGSMVVADIVNIVCNIEMVKK
jgi:polyisoprenoid-binding protein YceI